MSGTKKLQFGLRKLLLWTLVVSLWFPLLFLLTQDTVTTIAVSVAMAVAVLVRLTVGSWVAALALIPLWLQFPFVLYLGWDSPTACYAAFAIYGFVEVSYHVVNRIDHLLASKTTISGSSEGSSHE